MENKIGKKKLLFQDLKQDDEILRNQIESKYKDQNLLRLTQCFTKEALYSNK